MSADRRSLAVACVGIACVLTLPGVLLFAGTGTRSDLIFLVGVVLLAPGSLFAMWVNESRFWVQSTVLVASNIAVWSVVLYQAMLMSRRIRRAFRRA
jgi:predicted solute-binding protein